MSSIRLPLLVVSLFGSVAFVPPRLAFPPGGAQVTPDGTSTPDRDAYTSGYSASFTVKNTGSSADDFNIWCGGAVNVTCTGTSTTLLHLNPGQQSVVYAYYNVGAPGTGQIQLYAFGDYYGGYDGGYYVVPVVSALPSPIVDLSPHNYDHQVMGRCAASCFAATFAFSTVPYYSMDTPRNLTLVYHGDRVDPRPFVHVNVSHPPGQTPTPQKFWLQVKKSGSFVTFVNGEATLQFTASSTVTQRLGGQIDASSWGDGVFDIDVIVTADYGAQGTQTTTVQTKLAVVNEADSPIARGWTIAGVQRLYVQGDGSALVTEGGGSLVYFKKVGSTFVSPVGEFSVLKVNGSGWQRDYPDSTHAYFNSSGRMTDLYDRFDNRTQFFYDGSQRLYTVRDPYNKDQYLYYGTYGLAWLRQTIDAGRYTYVTVAANHTISAIRDPDGDSTRLGYDGALRMSSITDRRGYTTDLVYHAASGRTSNKLVRDSAPSVPLYTGGSARPTTTYAPWQLLGVPYSSTASTPMAVVNADTVYGRVTDPGGHTTRFTVDHWGQPVASTDPLNATTTVTYNASGLPIRAVLSTDPGAVDTAAYNANGMPTYVRPAGAPGTTIVYHGTWVAQPDSVVTSGLPTQRFWLGTNGRVDSVRMGSTYKERYTYDSRGRVETVKDALGTIVRTTWYAGTNGNRSKDSVPGGRITTYGYDAYGRNTTLDATGLATRTTYYDLLNRPDSVRDGVNAVATRFTYDDASNVVSVRDPAGNVYGFAYNPVGWVRAKTDPTGKADTLKYDVEGQLREWKNRRGQTTLYSYDQLHRVTVKHGAGTDSTTFAYSGDRRHVTGVSRQRTGPLIATDDVYLSQLGAVDSAVTNFASITRTRRYSYSAAGVLDSIWVDPFTSSTFLGRKYFFNTARGTLDSIRIGGKTRSSQFDANLRDTLTIVASGDSTFREYLYGGQSSGLVMSSPTVESFNRYLGYDGTGRIRLQFTDSIPEPFSEAYGYDALGRVIADTSGVIDVATCSHDDHRGWQCGYDVVEGIGRFAYDAVGNVTRDSVWDYFGFVSADTGVYGDGNRIERLGACTYDSDADGNITSRVCPGGTVTFSWSSDNRLEFMVADGDTVRFYYDAFGRVVRRQVGSAWTYFWWDGDDLYAEIGSDGAKTTEYLYYGMDRPYAIATGDSTVYFAARDGLGSVIGLESEAGGHEAQYSYDLWGATSGWENLSPTSATNRARFKGALWMGDEGTELYYMRARWYEPRSGRFLSEDPIGLAGGLDLYVFAGDDPVNQRDPTGTCFEPATATICTVMLYGAALGALGSGAVYYLTGSEGGVWGLIASVTAGAAFGAVTGGISELAVSTTALWAWMMLDYGTQSTLGVAIGRRERVLRRSPEERANQELRDGLPDSRSFQRQLESILMQSAGARSSCGVVSVLFGTNVGLILDGWIDTCSGSYGYYLPDGTYVLEKVKDY